MRKTKKTLKVLIESLAEVPSITNACKKYGIARNTFYTWMKKDEWFKTQVEEALDNGRDHISDIAKSKLFEKVTLGNMRAITYWLDNNDKDHLKPRKAVEPPRTRNDLKEVIVRFIDAEDKSDM
jgi:hypothetical protein